MVLVVKPHLKTSYELFRGRTPALSFMRPFGCHVIILNTLDHLGKFDEKLNKGFFVRYSTNSKAFRVYNTRTRKVEENVHINFLENKPIIAGDGLKWLFNIDALTESMNYVLVITCTNSNDFAEKGASFDAGQSSIEIGPSQDYILMPLWNECLLFDSSLKDSIGDNKDNDGPCKESEIDNQERPNTKNSTKDVNTAGPNMRSLDGVEVDLSNISTTYLVPTTSNTRIHRDHSLDNVIEPKRITNELKDPTWVEAIQEEILQFHLQKVWTLVDLLQAFLKKPQGSEDFHQIVDFVKASHIRTLGNREIELNATVDGQDKTITEASFMRHLKLADVDGISTLPTTKFFEQLALMSKQEEAHETAEHKIKSDDTEVVDFSTASPQKDDDEETLAETLVSIKKSATKAKGKAIMQESDPPKKIKKKEMIQISLDEEIAQRFYEEEQAQLLMDEEYTQQVQAQWVSDEARIA
nr:retrovirus-related Pol polyprotein from transposon TNT 1-94 [Tanacetum cinerariifolium]